MRRRSISIDRVIKRVMMVVWVVLVMMILGKAVGMADWQWGREAGGQGKTRAAQCLEDLWNYHYPGSNAKNGSAGKPDWFTWIWNRNPVYRFLGTRQEENDWYEEPDPAYSAYRSSEVFYQEHRYLSYYGDEESHQEINDSAAGSDVLVQNAETGEKQEALDALKPEQTYTANGPLPLTGTKYVMEQLADYDFLMKHFYSVHSSTTAGRDEMNAKTLLETDLSMEKDAGVPQILIYHTHSQEAFSDFGPEKTDATVVGIGNYLTELLQAKGYHVIHNTEVYDLQNGKLDRSKAYTYALEGNTAILQKYPSIQVILDVHRDGVKEGLRMVSEVNGKPTAPIMFFNGMSQTPNGAIEYLQNPYKEENLAFSLQMQLKAAAYYPGLTRKIYLKGLRYNLHLRPRSALIEVGAQTNTYQEALNAMEPLSELLDMVLQGQ